MSETKKIESVPNIRIFGDDQVLVSNVNGDRFVLSMQQAVDACGAFSRSMDLSKQIGLLSQKLADWSRKQMGAIRSAHLTIRDSRLSFVVVQKGVEFDEQLSDALTELDFEIADDPELDLIRLDTIAIPNASPESLAAFIPMESLD